MSERLTWVKSSYSDSQGGDCLEVARDWRRPTYSGTEGGACIEIAPCPHTIHIRDSKLGPQSPRFTVPGAAWAAFVAHASSGA